MKKKKKDLEGIKILILVIIVVSILLIFVKGYENKKLENFCLSIENQPDLLYPCKCVPGSKVEDIDKDIEEKTTPLCTCICNVNGTQMVFPVRQSR